jgi:hypothetical protein
MTSKFRVLLACLGAIAALSAIGAGSAQAARPAQPQWTVNGATIKSSVTVEFISQTSRLWSIGLSSVIVCTLDQGIALLEPGGVDKIDKLVYTGCSLHVIKKTSLNKFEEGEEATSCTVKSAGASVGEIVPKPIRTRLVWSASGPALMFDLNEPESGTIFVTIEIGNVAGKTCLEKANLEVEGSVLAWLPRFSPVNAFEEALMGNELLETNNGASTVVQRFTKWEVGSGGPKTAEFTIKRGETKEATAIESTEQVERPAENKVRPLFGATE